MNLASKTHTHTLDGQRSESPKSSMKILDFDQSIGISDSSKCLESPKS